MPRNSTTESLCRPQVVTPTDLKQSGDDAPRANPDDPTWSHRILADGDSWFSIGAVPSSNLLFELELDKPTLILNLAYPGDTTENMASLSKNPELRKMIHDERWGYKWDLILLSGGGNDLIDRAEDIICKPKTAGSTVPADYVNPAGLADLVAEVQLSYRQIIAVRDEADCINRGKPVVTHTYDYATPRDAPARFLFAGIMGPWLFPVFEKLGIADGMQIPVSDYLIDQLAEAIIALTKAPNPLPNFHVVETRHTLVPAAADDDGNSNDWLNEIHPNHQGYRKLAAKLSEAIGKIL